MNFLKKTAFASMVAAFMAAFCSAVSAKSLVYCAEASPSGFDPGLYTDGATYDASSRSVYSRLMDFEHGTTKIMPGLAAGWDVSDDDLTYTFHLRKGVKFQTTGWFRPTRDFNADDVIFSFERQLNRDHPWHNYLPGASWQYFESMNMPGIIRSIEKVDDYTVKFNLNRPEAPFIADMAMDFASIVSKEYADRLQAEGRMADLNFRPVGTGPFTFVAYQKDAVIRYRANPDYYLGKQPVDNLIFAITTDNSTRAQKLKAGECDIIAYPAPVDLDMIRVDPRLKVMDNAGMNISYLAYNTEEPPFDRAEVRHALNMAIDRQAILDIVLAGRGELARSPIPPAIWGYNKNTRPDEYNPEKAKKLLAEVGVRNLEMKIWAIPSGSLIPNGRRVAELMQTDLARVGIRASIISMEWAEYLRSARVKGRDGAVMMGWVGDNGDPDNFLGVLLTCSSINAVNMARWCYRPYEELVQKAKTTTDRAERVALYEKAQAVFNEQAPWLLIAHIKKVVAMSKKVTGYRVDPHVMRFDGVDIER